MFLPAVLVASLWGSWRAGVLAAVIGFALTVAVSAFPDPSMIDVSRQTVGGVLFSFNAAFMILLAQTLRVSIRNVDDARLVEQARAAVLAESETRFRQIAEDAPVMMWMTDTPGAPVLLNRALRQFWALPEDLSGFDWRAVIHPDDADRIAGLVRGSKESGQGYETSMRLLRADGEWRRIQTQAQPRFRTDGSVEGLIGVNVDVTDVEASERRHAFLLELGDAIRDLDSPGRILRTAAEALGRHLEAPRVGYGDVDDAQSQVSIIADWTDGSMSSATGVYQMDDFGPELSRDLRQRRTVAVSDVASDSRTEAADAFSAIGVRAFVRVPIVRGGTLKAFLFLHSDSPRRWTTEEVELTEEVADRLWLAIERAAAEAEVRESEARFRSIADSAPVLIWVTRADRRRAFVNQAYVAFHGGSYQDALNADWREALHPDEVDRVLAESVAGEASREPFTLEARYRRKDGAWRWLRSYSHPRLGGDGSLLGFAGVAYDVTEAKQVALDLTQINELLERRVNEALAEKERAETALMHAQKMEAVGRLTGGVAHDFNNLLTVVIGALDMVIRSPEDTSRRDRLLQAALSSARRGERLAHQLLAFSRRQALKPQLCDLNAVITEGEPLIRRGVGEAVTFNLKLESGLPTISIDPAHFEAALLNLVVNARDATPDGGRIEISTGRVTLGAGEVEGATEGDYVVVRVRDTGAGMSDEIRERVFEPFFTTKPVGKGTGLGLSQVYGFMRQSGGAARIDSTAGKGTTVSLYLPAMADAVPEITEIVEPVEDDRPYEGQTVLLVEDDLEVSAIARACLEQLGLEVVHAKDGPAALRRIKARSFDLLVTDMVMPGGLNGVDLANKVVDRRPGIAVLLSTGYAGESVERALGDAPWPLLSKPYDAQAMRRAVATAFQQRVNTATD